MVIMMAVILPPGSTSADLQAAIDSAASGDVIIISDNMPFTGSVTIPNSKEITIQSDTGNNWVMYSPGANTRHFNGVDGNLILLYVTLDGGSTGGGVVVNNGGSLTLGDESIVQNCTTSIFNGYGGGIVVRNGGRFTMRSTAVVRNCIATSYGGGVYLNGGSFDMGGRAAIDNCSAATGNDRYGGGVYLNNSSIFNMNGDAVIKNCTAHHGGGVYLDNSSFTISGDAAIESCAVSFFANNSRGGGVSVFNNGNFVMADRAAIKDCISIFRGGGISLDSSVNITITGESTLDNCTAPFGGGIQSSNSSFTISGGVVIQNCKADEYGGGVRLANSTLIMEDSAIIKDCMAATRGGGLFVNAWSTLIMIGDTAISGCKADNIGGGIYLTQNSNIEMNGGVISGNRANNHGGGIFTSDTTYGNLSIASDTVFNLNRASAAYIPPPGASVLYPNIQFANVSITDHPLNNFDINYIGDEPAKFNIYYNANRGTGSYKGPGISPDQTDTVLSPGETKISRAGFTFINWNTEPDGGGTSYAPGDVVILDSNKVLYAQWAAEPKTYTITYDCNGGTGHYTDHCREFEVYYTVLSTSQTGISRTGSTFTAWNTESDGSGISYSARQIITVNSDVTLYAQWRQIPDQKKLCRAPAMKCRKAIEGQKLWVDNDNAGNTRPSSVEILLLRDGEVYKRANVDSAGDGYFGFCCIPVWKNSSQKYVYRIDETAVPGYTTAIEGYNVINTLTP